jgi:DNA mismatch endonuclease Vsr
MERLTVEQRRKTMQAVKSTGSKIEKRLATALWKRGHRYRKNDKTVFGKPDLTFKRIKVAIFIDSEFWHGHNWKVHKHDHKSNEKYWHNKIERNIKRDKLVNRKLLKDGWKVVRFWGRDIEKKIDACINKVELILNERKKI